jgi:hypothetical protein
VDERRRRAPGARALLAAALLAPGLVAGEAVGQAPGESETAVTAVTRDPEDIDGLKRLAAGFWLARVKNDLSAQYQYIEPRAKGRATLEQWAQAQGPGPMSYLAYQVEDVALSGSYAVVTVRLLVRPNLPGFTDRRIGPQAVKVQDRWVRVGGAWYRVEPQPSASPTGPGR